MIELDRVSFVYDGAAVLSEVTLALRAGERCVLLGTNGSGKSTLLKLLNALLLPTAGTYRYKGEPMSARRLAAPSFARLFRREVVLLFQNPDAMIFNPTVFDEIAFGPRQLGMEDVEGRVHQWAARLGIERLLGRAPFQLSGGEKQKVCLAALLILEPEILLLDEPTANLDPRTTGWLIDFLGELTLTTLITTHNLTLAGELGDRSLVLSEEHSLIYDGPFDHLARDESLLHRANLLHTHRHRHHGLAHKHFHSHDWD